MVRFNVGVPIFLTGSPARRNYQAHRSSNPMMFTDPVDMLLEELFGLEDGATKTCHPVECRRHSNMYPFNACRSATTLSRRPWRHEMLVRGYEPSDIRVKVADGKVIVKARREAKQGEDYDVSETQRTVIIPTDVDSSKVRCKVGPNGHIILLAPRKISPSQSQSACCRGTVGKQGPDEKPMSGEGSQENIKPAERSETKMKTDTNTPLASCSGSCPVKGKQGNSCRRSSTEPKTDESVETEPEPTDKLPMETKPNNERPDDESTDMGPTDLKVTHTSDLQQDEENLSITNGDDVETTETLRLDGDMSMPTDSTAEYGHSQSPTPSDDFCLVDQSDDELKEDKLPEQPTSLPMENSDISRIVETDNERRFEVKINLGVVPVENIKVRCDGFVLRVDGTESRDEDVDEPEIHDNARQAFPEIHRQFPLPDGSRHDLARATVDEAGFLAVSMPIERPDLGQVTNVPVHLKGSNGDEEDL